MPQPSRKTLIDLYNLEPHPEGGYFKETFRDPGIIPQIALKKDFGSDRNFSTAIYFLIPEGKKSHLHRIKSAEVWHFYLGGPMTLVEIHPDGKVLKTILGHDVQNSNKLQHVVPAGVWFGAYPHKDSEYSFVGCTVAPGFDFADFEMGRREELLKNFPKAHEEIIFLTSE